MSEISKEEENLKNCRIETIELPDKICQKSCRVCSSHFIKEIHEMRKSGAEFKIICDEIQKKYNYSLSEGSLSRHFKNYRDIMKTASAEIIRDDLIEESTELARHTKAIITMIDKALILMQEKMDSGLYKPDIPDLEKLFNIRHKILVGDLSGEKDLMMIFQKAQDKYGVEMTQGVALGLKFKD